MNKRQVIKILSKLSLIVTVLILGAISFWPIINSTNHTGYEPYYFIIPFTILAVISFVMLIFTEAKNINAITILLGFIAVLLLFTYKQFNIMLNYDEWLTRGMPNRFEAVPTMFWADTNKNISSENGIKFYTWKIPVKINLPEGENIEEVIVEEYDESYVDYCHSAYDFIEKALERNDIDFEFSQESGTFSEIAGLGSAGNNEWMLYLNGQKSPYKINEHCIDEDWDIELVYE